MVIYKRYLLITISILWSISAMAQCPFGNGNRVDCQYGCGNYTDNNHDNYCDYSSVSTTTNNVIDTPSVIELEHHEESTLSSTQESNSTAKIKTNTATEITESIDTEEIIDINSAFIEEIEPEIGTEPIKQKNYHFWLITLITFSLYVCTFSLMQMGYLKKAYHRRIWNALLLIVGLISCVLGFLMVIHLNYNFLGARYISFLRLHVEAGIAMTIIMLFHIAWHWKYFKNLFKKIKAN